MNKKQPWASIRSRLKKAKRALVNATNSSSCVKRSSSDASYRNKAQMVQLKRSIDKLKDSLKDAQKTNEQLTNELLSTRKVLLDIVKACEPILGLQDTINNIIDDTPSNGDQ